MRFDETSLLPIYKQIAQKIEEDILSGELKIGDRLLSINQFAEEHEIARDTVEKAYILLKQRGVIDSVKGKGYFISREQFAPNTPHIFLHFNKLSLHKKIIYDALITELGEKASLELFIHHDNVDLFAGQLQKALGRFSYFIIIPPDTSTQEEDLKVVEFLELVSHEKLYILEKIPKVYIPTQALYQDYALDIYTALSAHLKDIKKYAMVYLVFPLHKGYAKEVLQGFTKFCVENVIKFNVLSSIEDSFIIKKGLYIVIDDEDLVRIIQISNEKNIKISKHIGIISYNDTALKEILVGGVSVLSTDFKKMGKEIAKMVLNKEISVKKNEFYLKRRNTF